MKICKNLLQKLTLFILLFVTGFAVAQVPTITSVAPNPVCQGDQITITGTNFTGATDVRINNAAANNIKVVSATSVTADVPYSSSSGKVSVITPKGTATSTFDLTVKQSPQPALQDVSPGNHPPFSNCNRSLSYTITVQNISVPVSGDCDYKIDWGDNTTPFTEKNWSVNDQAQHTYNAQGYFKLKLTITPTDPNKCTRSITYNFYSGGNAVGGFGTSQSTIYLCAPASISF